MNSAMKKEHWLVKLRNFVVTFILFTMLFVALGYIGIEYHNNKFEQLCKDRPDIEQCPRLIPTPEAL